MPKLTRNSKVRPKIAVPISNPYGHSFNACLGNVSHFAASKITITIHINNALNTPTNTKNLHTFHTLMFPNIFLKYTLYRAANIDDNSAKIYYQ
eukprot:6136_1